MHWCWLDVCKYFSNFNEFKAFIAKVFVTHECLLY